MRLDDEGCQNLCMNWRFEELCISTFELTFPLFWGGRIPIEHTLDKERHIHGPKHLNPPSPYIWF